MHNVHNLSFFSTVYFTFRREEGGSTGSHSYACFKKMKYLSGVSVVCMAAICNPKTVRMLLSLRQIYDFTLTIGRAFRHRMTSYFQLRRELRSTAVRFRPHRNRYLFVSAHRLTNITHLTLVQATLCLVVPRGVADLYT